MEQEHKDRLKKVALAATAIALGSLAMKKNRVIEDKILHTSFWETSQSLIVDLIEDGKARAIRLSGVVRRDSNNNVVDVELDDREYSEEHISQLEDAVYSSQQPELES